MDAPICIAPVSAVPSPLRRPQLRNTCNSRFGLHFSKTPPSNPLVLGSQPPQVALARLSCGSGTSRRDRQCRTWTSYIRAEITTGSRTGQRRTSSHIPGTRPSSPATDVVDASGRTSGFACHQVRKSNATFLVYSTPVRYLSMLMEAHATQRSGLLGA